MAKTKIRQAFGFVLAALLTLALTPLAAFADGETPAPGTSGNGNGTITIENAVDGYTYTAYQILVLESFNADNNAYSYTIPDAWKQFFAKGVEGQPDGPGAKYVNISETGYVTWAGAKEDEQTDAADLATAAVDYAIANEIAGKSVTAAEGAAVITGLDLGYYAVDSSMGALCSLNTTATNANIQEKNEKPKLDKQVQEGDAWGDLSDASIGDTVNFRIIVTGAYGAQNYVVHDVMDDGLTFEGITAVIDAATNAAVPDDAWSPVLTPKDDCTFEVTLADSLFAGLEKGQTRDYIIEYTAVLNDKAVATEPEVNKAQLEYGDGHKTVWEETKTYTWNFGVHKIYEGGNVQEGAEFSLTANTADGAPVLFVEKDGIYTVSKSGGSAVIKPLSANGSRVTLTGLDAGKYYLHETKTPEGYNSLAGPLEIIITSTPNDDKTELSYSVSGVTATDGQGVPVVDVVNRTGGLLPSTGGIGTTILYVVGGLLIVGAVVFLVVRRRQNAK